MLMAALRLNIPVIFVSGGPMEAGKTKLASHGLDLVDAMVIAADSSLRRESRRIRAQRLPDLRFVLRHVHRQLDELPDRSLGLALPGNGSTLATHATASSCSCRPAAPSSSCASATTARTTSRCCRAASPTSRRSKTP
jgi:dihydroxy-acid dehydratase